MCRLRHEAGLVCVHQTGATLTDRGGQARVGPLPHTEENIEAVRSALEPMEVRTVPVPEVNRPFVYGSGSDSPERSKGQIHQQRTDVESLDHVPGKGPDTRGTKPLSVKRGSLGALKRRPTAGRIVVLDPGSGRTEEPVSGCEPVAAGHRSRPYLPSRVRYVTWSSR